MRRRRTSSAAFGPYSIHLEAAPRNGELTATEAHECVLHASQTAGYANVSPLLITTEEAIAKVAGDAGPH